MKRIRFMQDLGDLLVFATSFWGVVALLSLLLPVANVLWGTIPLQPQLAQLGTILAVVMAFFALAYSFTEKGHILDFDLRRPFYRGDIVNPRRDVLRSAVARLAWGTASLVAYIALTAFHDLAQQNIAQAATWLIPVLEPVTMVLYAAAFALLTGAFGALAVLHYASPRAALPGSGSIHLGIRDETGAFVEGRTLAGSPDGVEEAHGQE